MRGYTIRLLNLVLRDVAEGCPAHVEDICLWLARLNQFGSQFGKGLRAEGETFKGSRSVGSSGAATSLYNGVPSNLYVCKQS